MKVKTFKYIFFGIDFSFNKADTVECTNIKACDQFDKE